MTFEEYEKKLIRLQQIEEESHDLIKRLRALGDEKYELLNMTDFYRGKYDKK